MEAGEIHIARANAFSGAGPETALVAVRPDDRYRLNRAKQGRSYLARRPSQGGGYQPDRVIGVCRPIRRLDNRSPIRRHADLVGPVAMLVRGPELVERRRALLTGDPKRHEGGAVQPLGMISKWLTDEWILARRPTEHRGIPSCGASHSDHLGDVRCAGPDDERSCPSAPSR